MIVLFSSNYYINMSMHTFINTSYIIIDFFLWLGGSAVNPLSWEVRLKILIDAARGLAFLHTSENKVIYRDFMASNILLDGSYNAKISDFGLAKFGPSASQSHVTTRVMGTPGYAAPESIVCKKRRVWFWWR
ncbi:unnamed protein product, partial [Cuscuta epithymum]